MTLEEKFFSMAESSEKAIEDFNDFADDRAVVWAAKEIRHLREMVKELTPNERLTRAKEKACQ
jgi:hypothetical protein